MRFPRTIGRGIFVLAAFSLFLASPAALPAGTDALHDARRQFDGGNYKQAVAALQSAVEKDPQNAALHYWLGRSYFELRDFGRAIKSAERSVELEPGNSVYHQWLGRTYGRRAEHAGWFKGFSLAKKTRHEFEEAARLDPRNFAAQHDLIEFYLEAPGAVGGGEDKANRQIDALAKLDAAEGHLGRGDYWKKKSKLPQAAAEYVQALESDPKRAGTAFEVADFFLDQKDAAHTAQAIQVAERLSPSDPQLDYYRAAQRILAGDRLNEAEKMLKNYAATAPRRSDLPSPARAREWLGKLYEQQGKREAAIEEYRAVLKDEPHNKTATEALRRLGELNGDASYSTLQTMTASFA